MATSLVSLGRFEEATGEMKRAVELDPFSLIINSDLGRTYYFSRPNDEAMEQLRKNAGNGPKFLLRHRHLGSALEVKGALEAAIAE